MDLADKQLGKHVLRVILAVSALLFCSTLLLSGNAAAQDEARTQAPRTNRVYLVPLRDASPSIDALAAHYRGRYGIATEVLAPLEIYGGQLNIWRQQVVAEELIALMRSSYAEIADNPESAMIGVISAFEMYAYGSPAPSVLDWRQDGRFAVVSSASLGSGDFRRPVAPELLHARLQKLVTRNVGMIYFGLPASGDPTSVLFANIRTNEDLDRMGPELPV